MTTERGATATATRLNRVADCMVACVMRGALSWLGCVRCVAAAAAAVAEADIEIAIDCQQNEFNHSPYYNNNTRTKM